MFQSICVPVMYMYHSILCLSFSEKNNTFNSPPDWNSQTFPLHNYQETALKSHNWEKIGNIADHELLLRGRQWRENCPVESTWGAKFITGNTDAATGRRPVALCLRFQEKLSEKPNAPGPAPFCLLPAAVTGTTSLIISLAVQMQTCPLLGAP